MTDRESTAELDQRPIAQPLFGPLAAELRAGLAHTSQNIGRGATLVSVHQRAIPLHLPDARVPLPELLQFLRLLLS